MRVNAAPTRRQLLAGAAVGLAAGAVGLPGPGPRFTGRALAAPSVPETGKTVSLRLVAAERPTALPCFGGATLPLWTFSAENWLPVAWIKLGDRLDTVFENRLPRPSEYSSIHWHGLRIPADQDGVPYLSQPPVMPGESFRYSFVPPDPGTFFFHTHCDTVEQMGRGLLGVLIVEGDTTEPYDADEIVILRDWIVDAKAGEFQSFLTLKGAGRAGTYGGLRSANGAIDPQITLPAAGDCRLRIINMDPTRIMEIAMPGAEAAVIAVSGVAVTPFPLSSWRLGPAMRIDVVLRAPAGEGIVRLVDISPGMPLTLAHFRGAGEPRRKGAFDPAPLRAGLVPEPDLASAVRLPLVFGTSENVDDSVPANFDGLPLGVLCQTPARFWTINGKAWPERGHDKLPPPLANLDVGRTYLMELKNTTDFAHPVHIHGHTAKVLRSSIQRLPVHYADTVLILPGETAEAAFVAGNAGAWMLHCHVIEHQESGMMAYFQIG